ncbi:ABC transporter substrate-binding protein [Leucobacter sp. gxy201]|uniref:ABC transporter substrate-binding protein n=1 Tax=Leucobacter sp. gxy201 TaxID=2957200 RepID=UPI003D9FE48C
MKLRHLTPALLVAAAVLLTGCVNDDAGASSTSQTDAPSATVARSWEEIEASGTLHVGTIVDYPPNEFKTDDGTPTGWAVDLVSAIADELGLDVEWEILQFDGILPRLETGSIDMGVGSFGDTVERQEVVDFVNYYNAGSLWAAKPGSGVDPDSACGLTVAVMTAGTQHLVELPERSAQCEADGKAPIEIMPFTGQPEVTNAVVVGKADAFSADSPVTLDAVAQLDGDLEVVGDLFDTMPYGFPIVKNSELSEHVRGALQTLIDNGTYLQILQSGHSELGAITEATINAGTE